MMIRGYTEPDLPAMIAIWNETVKDGHCESICPYYRLLEV